MQQTIRFIVMTPNEQLRHSLRAMVQTLSGVKIVAEVDEAALLVQASEQFPVDIVLVDLDPTPEGVLPFLSEIVQANPELAVFAVSESTDGPLILQAIRMGVKEFLPNPLDKQTLEDAISRVAVARTEAAVQGSLTTVIGTSGGVGATLLTTSIAVELAAMARGDVTVVDLDYRFGQVATFLDVEPKYSIADLCSSPEQLEPQVIARALAEHGSGVRVLSRPEHLAEADSITAASCTGVFANLLPLNEHVIADGPTRFDSGGRAVLALSDVCLLVVQPVVPCVRNAVRVLASLRDDGFNLDRVRLICNRMGRGSGHLSVDDVTSTLGIPALACLPDDWDTASGAINLGEPLSTFSPKSKIRLAIQEIAQHLHGADAGTDDKEESKQSLIGRIFASS